MRGIELKFSDARLLLVIVIATTVVLSACSSKGVDSGSTSATLNEDVAVSVASSLGEDNGGVTGQLKDIAALTSVEGLSLTAGALAEEGWVASSPAYDAGSGTWTWQFSRDVSSADGLYSAHVARSYEWRFKKSTGAPQIGYIVGHDTAYSIEFGVLDGEGRHTTPHFSQTLTELSASLVATGTNGNVVTVNGTCARGAVDTLFTHNATRSLDHNTNLTLTNIQFARGGGAGFWETVSGTITGTYNATIAFESGDAYSEHTVTRAINITLGDGQATIHLGGHTWTAGLRYGQLQ